MAELAVLLQLLEVCHTKASWGTASKVAKLRNSSADADLISEMYFS